MPAQLDLDTQQIPDNLQGCRRCDLWKRAPQAVAGAGAGNARIMLVGEQPGDEDLRGHPFVGPAGRVARNPHWRVGLALRPRAIYCFFNNTDEKLRAPADAKTLMKKLGLRWQI